MNKVTEQNPFNSDDEYDACLPNWVMVDTLMGNSSDIRRLGTVFLLKNEKEHPLDYQHRLQRSWLPPGYSEEVYRSVGKVFSYEKNVIVNTHPDIEKYLKNFDLNNNSIEVIARQIFFNMIQYGVGGGLVDYSEQFQRPFFNLLSPLNVKSTTEEMSAGHSFLRQIRIQESYSKQSGDFGKTSDNVMVVFDADCEQKQSVKVRFYKADNTNSHSLIKETELINEKNEPVTEIPICVCYGTQNHKGVFRGSPTLLRFAEHSIILYNAHSDLDNLIHVAMVPKLVIHSDDDSTLENLTVGAFNAIQLNQDDTIAYLTGSEKSIECGEKQIERIKNDRGTLGFSSLFHKNSYITATTRALDSIENNSLLAGIMGELKNCLDNALRQFAIWKGIPVTECGSVLINTDFSHILADEDQQSKHLSQMIELWRDGGLSLKTLLQEHKRLGFFADDFDIEQEISSVNSDKIDILKQEREK